jgi:peptidoglycan/LPS O-acetylase OafA/YrhL
MRIGIGLFAVALLVLLAGSLLFAYSGPGDMPLAGWSALVAGVTLSLIIGIGLMALLFYSSRQGYDEPPKLDDK